MTDQKKVLIPATSVYGVIIAMLPVTLELVDSAKHHIIQAFQLTMHYHSVTHLNHIVVLAGDQFQNFTVLRLLVEQ